MPKQLQKKQVESLVDYVDKLQSLNEKVKPKFPKISAEKLRKDPKSFAYDVIEASFIKHIPSFIAAYKHGKQFGKELIKNAEEITDQKNI